MTIPDSLREMYRQGSEDNLKRMVAENTQRPNRPCDCGRGPVVTLFGCRACQAEASREYEKSLLSDRVGRR